MFFFFFSPYDAAPLNVQIGRPLIQVDLGQPLTLNCTVTGGPVKSMEWLHNGRPISAISTGPLSLRIRLLSREVLHIAKVTRADRGMYQCVAFNDYDSAQAQTQLELGGELSTLPSPPTPPPYPNHSGQRDQTIYDYGYSLFPESSVPSMQSSSQPSFRALRRQRHLG